MESYIRNNVKKKKESKVAQNVFSQKTYSTKYFTTIWSFHENTNENENITLAFQILVFDNTTISIYFIQNTKLHNKIIM